MEFQTSSINQPTDWHSIELEQISIELGYRIIQFSVPICRGGGGDQEVESRKIFSVCCGTPISLYKVLVLASQCCGYSTERTSVSHLMTGTRERTYLSGIYSSTVTMAGSEYPIAAFSIPRKGKPGSQWASTRKDGRILACRLRDEDHAK